MIIITTLLLFFSSCEKLFMEPDASSEPQDIFEDIWTFTDTHYSFFEYKDIDWDEVKRLYSHNISSDMGAVELFDLCAAMLYELKDGHVNLVSSFDRSRNWEWYLNSPENFYYKIIERYYFKERQRYIGPLVYVNMDDIAYVYYGSFGNRVGEGNLDLIMSIMEEQDKKGIIIDVRNNGGGSIENARDIAARFAKEETYVGTNWIKNGAGHEDFRKEDVYIKPHDGKTYTGDVVLLTNRKSYSATTYFTQYMSELENVTIVGDTTGGGGGMPAFTDLANGWLLRVSSSRFIAPDGSNIESGIPPDHQVDIDAEEAFENKEDAIIETAIKILRE